jgi:glycosylphosphatidylinositol transamidase
MFMVKNDKELINVSCRTYFSENALLPGLVRGEFDEDGSIYKYLEDLKDEAEKYPNNVPFPWLEATLRQLGLEVFTHNFTINYPLSEGSAAGQNLYAILRAPRASSTEALILSVPYRPPTSFEQGTAASVAVLLASAKFFRRQYYWAKDIIFLITQHEQLGAQAWLEAYHQRSCGAGVLDHGDLEARAGAIQAAINLEISDPKITHFNVKVEGLNGQLPNLDLVNLINRLCQREGVGQLFQGMEDHPRPESWKGYQRSLKTLMYMIMKQSTGIPSGNHGLFHRFGIESVTIEGVFKKRRNRYEADMLTVGRVVEGIFRSLNNLLERFHQSFFFYLLPSSSRYVSIGMYMPIFGCLAGSIVLAGTGLWFQSVQDEKIKKSKEVVKETKEQDGQTVEVIDPALPVVIPESLLTTLPTFLLAHLLGLVLVFLPELWGRTGRKFFDLETEDAVGLGILAFSLFTLFLPKSIRRAATLNNDNWKVLKCLALMEFGTLVFTVSLCNFSLALVTSIIYVPMALTVSPSKSHFLWGLKLLLTLLTHPLVLLSIFSSIDNYNYTETINFDNFIRATKSAIMYTIVDGYIYGNISYSLVTMCLLPCWYLFWCLNFITPHPSSDPIKAEKAKKNQ